MFNVRPKSDDTEEDLLKFQEEFLASGSKPAATVVRKRKNAEEKVENDPVTEDVTETSQDNKQRESRKRSKFYEERNAPKASPSIDEDMEAEMEKHDTHIVTVLSKITERDTTQMPVMYPGLRSQAFPSVFHRTKNESISKTGYLALKKKSIFAQQFSEKPPKEFGIPSPSDSAKLDSQSVEPCSLKPLKPGIPMDRLKSIFPESNIITGVGLLEGVKQGSASEESRRIHEESLEKLSSMEESEILAEKQKLLHELDPKLIKFLQQREKSKLKEEKFLEDLANVSTEEDQSSEIQEVQMETQPSTKGDSAEVPIKVEGKWLHMDEVESEKLAWMSAVPKKHRKEIELSHRFDFHGNIINEGVDVPTHLGLHHHGDEPHAPGYNLQELFILSRSNFAQQRNFAVNMIGKIVAKARHGEYRGATTEPILQILIQSGVLFLLRWSLDEQSETSIQASVSAMHSLLVSEESETMLDSAFHSSRGCEVRTLTPLSEEKPTKDESDYEVAAKDVIAGLLKTNIVSRIRYILEVCKPSQLTVNQCLDIVVRICRHSTKSALVVFECPRLMDFIISSLLPTSHMMETDESSSAAVFPYPRAVRLLRALCTAGRHLTSRMLNKYRNLKTVISTLVMERQKVRSDKLWETELEIWRFWIVCCSYGFLCKFYREMYKVIVTHIHSFTTIVSEAMESKDSEMSYNLLETVCERCQLVFLLCHAVLTASDEDKLLPIWPEITQLIPLVSSAIKVCLKAVESVTGRNREAACSKLRVVISTGIAFLSTFYEHLRGRADYDITQAIISTNNLSKDILLPVFQDLVQTRLSSNQTVSRGEILPSLPEYDLPSDVENMYSFQILSSLLQCCVTVSKINKECCKTFLPLISSLADNCTWMTTSENNNSSFFSRSHTNCLYWAVELYTLVVTHCEGKVDQLGRFFYNVGFRCFSQMQVGDEHLMHHLLSAVIFHPKFFNFASDETKRVTETMSALAVTHEQSTEGHLTKEENVLLNSFASLLPSIRSTYMTTCSVNPKVLTESKMRFFHKASEISTFLLPSSSGPCVPSDWPFLPLLQLYNHCIEGADLPDRGTQHIVNSLYYTCLLETHFSECLSAVNNTSKIVRLMCVFLAANDLFLDDRVKQCLSILFHKYCNVSEQSSLDFSQEISGISSFYDFYVSLLEQYEGVSYGDHLFSAVLLLPLHQHNHGLPDIKKAFWCEHRQVVRILSLPLKKLLLPFSWYLYPAESDVFMIRAYLSALATSICSHPRCPLPYVIAVHHIAQFILCEEMSELKTRREIYHGVLKIQNQQVRTHILHYISPDPDPASELGFTFTPETTPERMQCLSVLK